MNRQNFALLVLSFLVAHLLTSCATRPYFVIENKSKSQVIIELVFDSLNINEIIARDTLSKAPSTYFNHWDDPSLDSLKQSILNSKDKEFIKKYIYNSISLYSLPHPIDFLGDFQIANLNKIEPYETGEYTLNFDQKLFEYYNFDSTLINEIINNNSLPFILPPDYSFYKVCRACGECSCDTQFPTADALRIVFGKDDYLTMSNKSFFRMMKNTRFHGRANSYVYTIE